MSVGELAAVSEIVYKVSTYSVLLDFSASFYIKFKDHEEF